MVPNVATLGSKPLTPNLTALALNSLSPLRGTGLPSPPRGTAVAAGDACARGNPPWRALESGTGGVKASGSRPWGCGSHWGPPARPPSPLRVPCGAVPLLQVLQGPPGLWELTRSRGAPSGSGAGLGAAARTWGRQGETLSVRAVWGHGMLGAAGGPGEQGGCNGQGSIPRGCVLGATFLFWGGGTFFGPRPRCKVMSGQGKAGVTPVRGTPVSPCSCPPGTGCSRQWPRLREGTPLGVAGDTMGMGQSMKPTSL